MRDPHQILGVPRHATAEQIRAAYRRLARELHPDVCADPDAARRFAAVAEAYERLTDPQLSPPRPRPAASGDASEDEVEAAEVYDVFFRSAGPARAAPRARRRPPVPPTQTPRAARPDPARPPRGAGPGLTIDVPLSVTEAAEGATVTVPTPNGPVLLTVPAGTPDARTFRIPGADGASPHTDLVVRVRVIPPSGAEIDRAFGQDPPPARD
jgi:hypothetical protein